MHKVVINIEASDSVKNYFLSKDYEVLLFEGDKAYKSVKNHPDLYMFYDDFLFCDPDVEIEIKKVFGPAIGNKYPENIKYNLAKVGHYIIGLKKMVPEVLLKHFEEKHYIFIDVPQGYAKCSTAVVDDNSLITADKSIYKACTNKGLNVLLIEEGHILLPGLSHGFIGGCSVRLEDEMFFSGNIKKHPDYESIKLFLNKRNVKCIGLQEPLIDLGSFIIIESV